MIDDGKARTLAHGGALFIVGTGPGHPDLLTRQAERCLRAADAIVGYRLYLELLRPLLPAATFHPGELSEERARAALAIDLALAGRRVALVGSGDAGVYGLAGLALELLEERGAHELPVEVVPGVTAALSAAALLGAPLGHDFCAISLSDLLTPWEAIQARLEAAAQADFVTVLYNPASARRRRQLEAALAVFLRHRPAGTPVGMVRNAYREQQSVILTSLTELPIARVDMLTTVVIGNSATRAWNGRLITPRGYRLAGEAQGAPATAAEPAPTDGGIVLVGHGSRDAAGQGAFREFAAALEQRLGEPVAPAFLEFNEPPIVEAVRRLVAGGARRLTVMPLFLGAATHQKNDVPAALHWLRAQHGALQFDCAAPLGAHAAVADTLAQRALEACMAAGPDGSAWQPRETALLLVGRGSHDPDSNGELFKTARLVTEGRRFALVESCFIALTEPDVAAGVDRCARLGARRVVLAPQLLFPGVLVERTRRLALALAARYPELSLRAAAPLGAAPPMLDLVLERIREARAGLARANCDTCKYRVRMAGFEDELGLPQGSDHNHGLRGTPLHTHGADHAALPAAQAREPAV
ncbi:MAG TPA: precorrin-3B C(17)-methyltransferase [Dehalococcoidia bacterium]|nr:precorrin-3B C(17)-methyltransferase [Dehalococcoidia bacterium]